VPEDEVKLHEIILKFNKKSLYLTYESLLNSYLSFTRLILNACSTKDGYTKSIALPHYTKKLNKDKGKDFFDMSGVEELVDGNEFQEIKEIRDKFLLSAMVKSRLI
jgi:hypothetical protein